MQKEIQLMQNQIRNSSGIKIKAYKNKHHQHKKPKKVILS